MSEYITGRLSLSEGTEIKGKKIKSASKGKEGDLEFILEGAKIRVDKVPSHYGVRCGAIVEGYTNPSSTEIRTVSWPSKSKKRCTLSELMSFNKINKTDTLIVENEVLYCTHWLKKIDTKMYGLPQTRERTYMLVPNEPDNNNVDDDLGVYWQAIVEYLSSPVKHSLESFILDVDHDIIRTFREALNGPAGR